MRRKPVVVVGVAAVLLGVGVIAAGRAGAQETPQWPDIPGFSLAGLPGFSAFGGDDQNHHSRTLADSDATDDSLRGVAAGDGSAGRDGAGRTADLTAAGQQAAGQQAGVGQQAAGQLEAGQLEAGQLVAGQRAVGQQAAGQQGAGQLAPGHKPAAGQRPAPAPAGQRPAAAQGAGRAPAAHAVPEMPKAQKPAATAQRVAPQAAGPMRPKAALSQQDAARSLVARAKVNVTASDISSSPSSPVQQQILTLINQNRRQHGCRAVTIDRRLIGAANAHAADMARHDYFAHDSRDGSGAGDRVTHAGYTWRHYGENIARGVDSPYAVVDGWMHSPEHRQNILDCSLDQMGIGLAIAGDKYRTVYWVQDFATPM